MRSHQILGCASFAAAASIGGVNQTLGRADAKNADANRYPNQCLFLERYCADRWHYRYTVGNARRLRYVAVFGSSIRHKRLRNYSPITCVGGWVAKAVQWLADNHDKLADNLDEVDVPEPSGASDTTLAAEEEHILRCLGRH